MNKLSMNILISMSLLPILSHADNTTLQIMNTDSINKINFSSTNDTSNVTINSMLSQVEARSQLSIPDGSEVAQELQKKSPSVDAAASIMSESNNEFAYLPIEANGGPGGDLPEDMPPELPEILPNHSPGIVPENFPSDPDDRPINSDLPLGPGGNLPNEIPEHLPPNIPNAPNTPVLPTLPTDGDN